MNDPRPVSDHLEEARQRLLARQVPPPPDDLDVEELARVRASGVEELRRQRWSIIMPSRFVWASLEDFAGSARKVLDEWATEPTTVNLLVTGPVGVGKSHAAVAACRPAFERGLEVQFWPVGELLDQLRPGGPEGAFTELTHLDRLIVDDLGTQRDTDWTDERLSMLVNRRWLEERPTVVTTNLPPDELEKAVGERTYSRLVGNGAVAVRLTGKDRRRQRDEP